MIVVRHPSRALAAPLLAALLALDLAAAERHELVISNEPAGIDIAAATLSGGHDGHLYLHQPGQTTIIRIASDGSRRAYTARSPALTAVAAGPDGSIATAHAHFQHRVDVHDAELVPRGGCADFLNDDQAGWISPCDVQAGRSGDFYAPDNARGRVLRLGPAGAVVATIPLDVLGTAWRADSVRLRVWEGGSLLYIAEDRSGILSAVRFDGTLAWSAPLPLGGNQWDGYAGAFDVDGNGRVHVLRRDGGPVMVYSHEGAALAPIALAGTLDAVAGIVVRDGAIHVKRRDQKELFRTYDRASGALVRTVPALVDVLSVTLGSDVIEAGRPAPATVEWASALTPRPRLTAWIARHPDGDFREVALDDGTLTTPDGVFGPCVLRVTTGADGSSGGHAVELPVEVRRTGSTGTITTWTRDGRHAFRRGEEVPLVLSVRGPSSPTDVELRLVAADGRVVATERVTVTGARDVPLTAGLTGALPPGRYEFEADAPGLTPVATAIELGVAASDANPFRITMYGDYVPAFGGTTATWPAEEIVARRARYERTLGLDTVVDRLHAGAGIDPLHGDARIALHAAWAERLESRPDGPDPARLRVIPTPLLRMIERRSASGIDQRGIALSMDAGVPLGVPGHGYDARSPDQVASDVARVTKGLSHIIGFRGWSWAANWWLDQRLPDDEGESKAFLAARERALTDGGWDPILDTVTDRRIGSPDEARRGLDAAARAAAPGKTLSNAMTGPWRQPGIIPPTTFAGTDEVDLHVQLEQIGYPHAAGQLADFLARPGKPAWAHPEIWNDDGTGDQILTTHAMLAMTGATGIGSSPLVCPQMAFTDPRSGYRGRISAHRASHRWFDLYGPWLAELRRSPTILIPVSTRMMRIDEWANVGGRYFTALYEAWNACAFAARPASFVFVDDLDGVDWDGVSAVLVVAQRADAEPRLARALRDAKARGIVVVADGTSRAAAVPDASVIAVSFDRALA
ncbi:MAG TPA: hypothetical protein VEL07_14675, partial [Planctomycetota bacterium]|nr:hypothetical protein [Planctomycetota bacterium]